MLSYNIATKFDFSRTPKLRYNNEVRERTFVGDFSTNYQNGPGYVSVYGCVKTDINTYETPEAVKYIFYKGFDFTLYPKNSASEIETLIRGLHFMKTLSANNLDDWIPDSDKSMNREVGEHLQKIDLYSFSEKIAKIILRPGWTEFVKEHNHAEFYWWTNKGLPEPNQNIMNKNGKLNFDKIFMGNIAGEVIALDCLAKAEEKITAQPHRELKLGYPNSQKNVCRYTVDQLVKEYVDKEEQIPKEIVVILMDNNEYSLDNDNNTVCHAGYDNKSLMLMSKYTHVIPNESYIYDFLKLIEEVFPIRYFKYISDNETSWSKKIIDMLKDPNHGPLLNVN